MYPVKGASLARLDLLDIDLIPADEMRARALAERARFAVLHRGVGAAAVLAQGNGGQRLDGEARAVQQLRSGRRPVPAVLQISMHHAGDLTQLQRHRGDAAQLVLPPNLLDAVDDMEYDPKLMHRLSRPFCRSGSSFHA